MPPPKPAASSAGCRGPSPPNRWSEESKDAFDRQMVECQWAKKKDATEAAPEK
jgi:hypothetical protein